MCGIIGYTGQENAVPKILEGLRLLEYRGYDSAGVAVQTEDGCERVRCRGRIVALEEKLRDAPLPESRCALGHTRWATHGSVSERNAHPHRAGSVTLVHNGIIENCRALKEILVSEGVRFTSETDTEIAAAWMDRCLRQTSSSIEAVRLAQKTLVGSYAFAILFDGCPGTVYAVRKDSPLLLAKGKDGFYLASDMTALLPFTREYAVLDEGSIAVLTPDSMIVTDSKGRKTDILWQTTSMSLQAAQKGGYEHFMLKEMFEQPDAIKKSVVKRIRHGLPDFSDDGITDTFWNDIKAVQIAACGSAMHAGLLGAGWITALAEIPAAVYIASEYRYAPPAAEDGTLVAVISQSGETADTLAALRCAKEKGMRTLAIVNAPETTIAREADRVIYTCAGPEIAVATTKGYATQLAVLRLLAVFLAHARGRIAEEEARNNTRELTDAVPWAVKNMLERTKEINRIAQRLAEHEHVFYIGRTAGYALAEEGALKLKEISYIHAEAYAAGELKHGTISLVREGTPVIALSTEEAMTEKIETGIREVRSRGAYTICIGREQSSADETIVLNEASDTAALFAAMTAMQLLAYETARLRGCDIDRPKNLAKSVTVE